MSNDKNGSFLFGILRNVIRISFLLLFLLIPLAFSDSLANPAFSSKTILFMCGLALFCFLGSGLLLFASRPFDLRITWLDLALAVYVVYILLNRYLLHAEQGFSLKFIEFGCIILLYIILRISTMRDVLYALLATVVGGLVVAVYGTLQLLGYLPKSQSGFIYIAGFINAGPFAGFLVAMGIMALGIYLFREQLIARICNNQAEEKKEPSNKLITLLFGWLSLAGVAAVLIVLPAARSRAAWVAFAVAAILLFAWRYKDDIGVILRKGKISKTILTTAGVLLLIAITGWGIFKIYSINNDSANGRLLVWKVTGTIIKENPVTGVGFDRFKAEYMNAQAKYFQDHHQPAEILLADNTYYAFNELLQTFAEQGLVGLLLIGSVVFACMRIKSREEDLSLKVICYAIIAAVILFGLFSYPMQILPIRIILVTALALLAKQDTNKIITIAVFSGTSSKAAMITGRLVVMLAGIALSAWLFTGATRIGSAYMQWQQALTGYRSGLYKESIPAFEAAWPVLKNEGDFLMQYGKALSMAEQYTAAKKILLQSKSYLNTSITETTMGDVCVALQQFDEAEAAYKQAALMIPSRVYPDYLLAKLYHRNHQPEKAKVKAREVLAKNVKVQSAAVEEIKEEMKRILDNTANSNNVTKTSPIE